MIPKDRLVDVATTIADGTPVDWAAVLTEAGPSASAILGHLQLVQRIASVHAGLPGEPSADGKADAADEAAFFAALPTTWGSLAVLERVGRGTYAEVYRAHDPRLDRRVALKLLRGRDRAASRADAIEEGRLLARVQHPNVVAVYGAERVDGRIGIWMEFVDGRTLEDELRAGGPFSPAEVLHVGMAICHALGAVHDAGLLHRDIKAQNVMRARDGRVLLTDFGTGHDFAHGGAAELAGTPLYLAPEVLDGRSASMKSDIYSLGVLLYHLATGSFPIRGRSVPDLRDRSARVARVRLRETRPDFPERLAAVIERAAGLDPNERYQTAGALASAMGAAAEPRRTGRRTVFIVAGAALLLAVAGTGTVLWQRYASAHRPFRARDWVLVAAFDNRTGDGQFDGTVESAVSRELGNSAYVNVVPRERVEDALRLMERPPTTVVDALTGQEVARRDGEISRIVDGAIERSGSGYVLTAQVRGHTGIVETSYRQDAATVADISIAARRLSNWVRLYLGEAPMSVTEDEQRLEKVTTPSLRAVELYTEASVAARHQNLRLAETQLRAALVEDPDFASADMLLAWVIKNENVRNGPETYLPSAQRALALVDGTSLRERDFIVGSNFVLTGQLERAIAAFEDLVQHYPDDGWRLTDLCYLYQRAQRREDADNLYARIAALRPNDFFANVDAAQALVTTRGLDAARSFVTRAQALVDVVAPPGLRSAPNNSLMQGGNFWPRKSWLLLYPVHERWATGRAQEAATILDRVEQRGDVVGERFANDLLGSLHLALGQLRLADQAFARETFPDERALGQAEVALARHDFAAVVEDLRNYPALGGTDRTAVSILIRAGNLPAAESLRSHLSLAPGESAWVLAELAAARGTDLGADVRNALEAGVHFFDPIGGVRALLYSETLADVLNRSGDTAGAIRELEGVRAMRERDINRTAQTGYFWMRTQLQLADSYRQVGQVAKARAIERDLKAVLAAADDDNPLLVELRKRG